VEPLLGADWHGTDFDIAAALHPLDMLAIVRAAGCEAQFHPSPSDSTARRFARRLLWHFGPGWWLIARRPAADCGPRDRDDRQRR
jgi:hypothetical protein